MKTYKSADLTHKRAEVFREAEANGVIIQQCRTNGEVISEFILASTDPKGLSNIQNEFQL